MSAISKKTTVIDIEWLMKNRNKKSEYSPTKRITKYFGKWKGEFLGALALKKVAKLGAEIGKYTGFESSIATLKNFDKNIGYGIGGLGILALPAVSAKAIKSLSTLRVDEKVDGVPFQRKAAKAVKAVGDTVSAYSAAIVFIFKASPVVRTVAHVAGCLADVADFHVSYTNYRKAEAQEMTASKPVKLALEQAKQYYFLNMIKNISSIACAVLGMTLFLSGGPLILLIILSIASTAFSIQRDLYKMSQTYKPINFDVNNLVCK
jgi:hypothetical protein